MREQNDDKEKEFPTVLAEFSSVVADTQQYILPTEPIIEAPLLQQNEIQVSIIFHFFVHPQNYSLSNQCIIYVLRLILSKYVYITATH